MFQFMRGTALVAVMLLGCGACFAEGYDPSANRVISACRAHADANIPSRTMEDAYLRGDCAGTVSTVVALAKDVCSPKGSTTGQSIRIVVKYIDERTARMHENFTVLALEALRAAWPCNK